MSAVLRDDESVASVPQMEALARRESLSAYLPYIACDTETALFTLHDGAEKPYTHGYLWECSPLAFASQREFDKIASLLRKRFPDKTVVQFILYADDNIDPILRGYQALKKRNDGISKIAAKHYTDFLREGVKGFEKMSGIVARNFRCFCTVKSPHETGLPDELLAVFEEQLRQIHLHPTRMKAPALLELLRRMINRRVPANPQVYTEDKDIRNQILESGTPIRRTADALQIGEQWAACITPMVTPTNEEVDGLSMNQVIGGFWGVEDDANQINNRFLWTTSIFYSATVPAIKRKLGMMASQRPGARIAKRLETRIVEGDWVLKELETKSYCNVLTSMWLFADTKPEVDAACARAMTLWEKHQFMMQRDTKVHVSLFIASLPFGLYLQGRNTEIMQRDFQMSVDAAAYFVPIQADFAGRMSPMLLTVGRKGQIQTCDVFDKGANNHNLLVCANSGAGKSFNTNAIVQNYYAAGAKIRITDIGDSYKKQCMMVGGRYVDVGAEAAKLCLNPFMSVAKDEEDAKANEVMTANILLTMAFSATGTADLDETHWTLMKDAVRYAMTVDGGVQGVDQAYRFLKEYPKLATTEAWEGAAPTAHEMAFNLRDFCTFGKYGSLFNGKSTLDMSCDDFVVLELDRIINDSQLFSVIAMQVINAITQDLYLSDRSTWRFMLFDEAWKYFGSAPMIAKIIEEGYRRARKYLGSTGIITQSPLDLRSFGPAGQVIRTNSAFKFFMECEDYVRASREGVLEYNGLMLDLASSVKNQKPRYSEMLMDTPKGAGVGRLIVDPWTYWVYTSSGPEYHQYAELIHKGRTPVQALDELAARMTKPK